MGVTKGKGKFLTRMGRERLVVKVTLLYIFNSMESQENDNENTDAL